MRSCLAFGLPLAITLLAALAACEESSTPGGTGTFDGSTSFDAGGGPGETSTAADTSTVTPGVCTEPDYVNGTIPTPPDGQMSLHCENIIDATIVVSNGTIPCQAKFDPSAGVMVNAAMSGAYDIQCNDTKDDQYYGFHIHGLGKLEAGTPYTIGTAGVAGGALNNQVDLTFESGSRCGAKAATLREWVGGPSIPGRGTFTVDSVTGSSVKFSISLTDMKLSPKNVAGKGTFSLSVRVIDATPLTIVGL